MTDSHSPYRRGRWYWEEFSATASGAGADLAALRRGLGQEAGGVPELWPYHRCVLPEYVAEEGHRDYRLTAEHAALTLFAVHQQHQQQPMHVAGVGTGVALRALRKSEKFSEEAVDRRVNAAATSTDTAELVHHLRGLVTQLRGIRQPLDYTRLYRDIRNWHFPEGQERVRRSWGAQYYAWTAGSGDRPAAS
ncbi:type I-E CRISPR-associated protein Cse2/CasB [Streptomyces omiyaensis]|uniref:type I-E CRISPR-associated protein Cse2/CasB n=1 Tax=Streptomyces omiyaensis TaxID=68247 RepID=UPI0036FDAFD1